MVLVHGNLLKSQNKLSGNSYKPVVNKVITHQIGDTYNSLSKLTILSTFKCRERVYNFDDKYNIDDTFKFLKESIIYEDIDYRGILRVFLVKIKVQKRLMKDNIELYEYFIAKYNDFVKFCQNH
jgi:hypothetical protein